MIPGPVRVTRDALRVAGSMGSLKVAVKPVLVGVKELPAKPRTTMGPLVPVMLPWTVSVTAGDTMVPAAVALSGR